LTGRIIFWFRKDLRLTDNPALSAAIASGKELVSLYTLDDETPGQWAMGGASRWWLRHSLAALRTELAQIGAPLVLRRGPALRIVPNVAEEAGADAVYFTRSYTPYDTALERELAETLARRNIGFHRYGGNLLFEPERLQTKEGRPYKVFTPFYRAALAAMGELTPAKAPTVVPAAPDDFPSDTLDSWDLTPSKPDWADGLREAWTPGEAGAQERLSSFLGESIRSYVEGRDLPGHEGTSRLSPHLHFGEISPRQCWHQTQHRLAANGHGGEAGATAFLRELIWREFSAHLLHHFPDLPEKPLRPEFARFPWARDEAALLAWQKGLTGYPIVDAGMRQLWRTGWMHNRVRMIAASFLIKDLLIPWQEGAAWFWDTLVDADLANNSASWQWVAGSGADAAPFFRIFNPVTQGEKFDAGGAYVRAWVPEIASLPDKFLHRPWEAPEQERARAGIGLGKTYPHPIVDHALARKRALEAFKELKA